MDPYQVLGLSKNFTLDQLKKHYKKLVLKYHPDIAINSSLNTPIFQALTESYRTLYNEYNNRDKELDHQKLKQKFNDVKIQSSQNVNIMDANKSSKFDIDKFNTLYEQYAIKDKASEINEKGYGDWLRKDTGDSSARAVINYEEPQPLFASRLVCNYNEIGADKVKDFTNYDSKLPYMDLMKAHTMTKIVDESSVQMPQQFKNVEQLKAHRSNIEYVMTPEEHREYELKLLKKKKKELDRQKRIQEDAKRIEDIYNKNHKVLLQQLQ